MPSNRIRVILRQHGATRWIASSSASPTEVAARSKEACLRRLERELAVEEERPPSLVIEVHPTLVGVAEAAKIIGWDKRHVITYLNRGKFPEPLASLAGGRIWALDDIVAFARELRDRRSPPVQPD